MRLFLRGVDLGFSRENIVDLLFKQKTSKKELIGTFWKNWRKNSSFLACVSALKIVYFGQKWMHYNSPKGGPFGTAWDRIPKGWGGGMTLISYLANSLLHHKVDACQKWWKATAKFVLELSFRGGGEKRNQFTHLCA